MTKISRSLRWYVRALREPRFPYWTKSPAAARIEVTAEVWDDGSKNLYDLAEEELTRRYGEAEYLGINLEQIK